MTTPSGESTTIGGVHDEPSRVTVICPECRGYIVIQDVHAFVLSVHERVCPELDALHAET
jgi:hypothetical protein